MEEHQPHPHNMVMVREHGTGAEEWYCPTCGRRFLLQWPPNYKRIILEAGDEIAFHSATKGGLKLNVRVEPDDPTNNHEVQADGSDVNVSDVGAFADWLDQLDFGDDENTAKQ